MNKIEECELDNISGGSTTTLPSTVISALTNLIKLLKDAGYSIGSGFRRIGEKNLCPLE